ncbi:MAG TPA: hypothetical protein VMT37_03070 [Solirubrobacterales bacterium]|nr:hypothetical protein [Solirubrobacterales bacterium]
MAAVLACVPVARHGHPPVASHLTAGWLWGLLRFRPETPHVTVPGAQPHRRPRFVVHGGSLIDRDIAEQDRIPVTSLARTLLDLATVLSAGALGTAIERADKQGIFDLRAIDDVLNRAGRHNGAGRLREAADLYRPDLATTRSGLERRFRKLVRGAGLPEPAMNYVVAGMELDAYFETERFVVELDVYGTHGDPGSFERDRLREDELLLRRIEVMRITDTRLEREPRATIERVAAHLERRRRELAPGPP